MRKIFPVTSQTEDSSEIYKELQKDSIKKWSTQMNKPLREVKVQMVNKDMKNA